MKLSSDMYENNLYNLVKRRFLIKPNSTITWQVDRSDAKLDVTATYKVRNFCLTLMYERGFQRR